MTQASKSTRSEADVRAARLAQFEMLPKLPRLVALTERGVSRVLNGKVGMIFEVDNFTDSLTHGPNRIAHVRDYRYGYDPLTWNPPGFKPFQIWSLGVDDWVPARLAP